MKSIVTMLVLAVLAGISFAVPAVAAEHQTVPFAFTLTPEQCPDLASTISGSGEYFIRINERVDKDGVTHINQNTVTNGTATDEAGNTYRFTYHNNQQITISPGDFPTTVAITDHFNLVGAGGMNALHVGFTIRLTFAAEGEEPTVDEISVRGFPPCDPI